MSGGWLSLSAQVVPAAGLVVSGQEGNFRHFQDLCYSGAHSELCLEHRALTVSG
jgi:hypothetical protein